jgi:DGQHR domain-containing protein
MAADRKVLTQEDAFALMNDNLITDAKELRAEFNRRNNDCEFKKIPTSDVDVFQEKGWEEAKQYTRAVKIKRQKRRDAQLEDDTWCLFRRAGYFQMNKATLKVPFEREDGTVDRKQVDVFARDDETVLVVECKSRESRGRRSLQKDLAETKAFKSSMAAAIRTYYGATFRPKVVWVYVTRNILWSEPDLARCKELNVHVITENEMQYYNAFIAHMGPAGRFQLMAEFLKGQKIPELENFKVPAVRGKMGGTKYYAFVTTPRHLLKISFVNHLALNHPDGRPAYQRMIKSSRLKKIGEFITKGGFFPTNLLVNFSEECTFEVMSNKESNEDGIRFGWLTLPCKYKSAWIIDGQHRLYGYSFLDQTHWDQSLFILAFEKLDSHTEAELFITINHEQKSVPKAILVALQADLKWGAEDARDRLSALISALVKALAADPSSPLGQRFVIEGVTAEESQCLTIPEVAKGVGRSRLIGRLFNDDYVPGPLSGATDDLTIKRAKKVISSYFDHIRNANEQRWELGRAGYIATNPGIRAHLQVLAELLIYLDSKGFNSETAPEDAILEKLLPLIAPILMYVKSATDSDVQERFGRKFGEGGVKDYFFNLCELIAADEQAFGPNEFKEYMTAKNDERYEAANADVNRLAKRIVDHVYETLVNVYGTTRSAGGEEAYWEEGISNAKAKTEAYSKRQQNSPEKRLNVFAYLDLLDLRDIVRQAINWSHFEAVFSIPMPDEQKGKKYYIQWMEEFNELRRIPGHPTKLRPYREADYEFLEWLKRELLPRLDAAKKHPMSKAEVAAF